MNNLINLLSKYETKGYLCLLSHDSFHRRSPTAWNAFTSRIHTCSRLQLNFTPILFAEPLKKKKKIDPAVIRAREERRKKKLEKLIRRMEKNARQLKPIDDLEVPLTLIDEKE